MIVLPPEQLWRPNHGTSRPRRPPSRDRLPRSWRCKRRLGSAGIGDRLPSSGRTSHNRQQMGTTVRSHEQQSALRDAEYRPERAIAADASTAKATISLVGTFWFFSSATSRKRWASILR